LFSQLNRFFGLRKDAEGAKRTKIGSLRELRFLCHTEITEISLPGGRRLIFVSYFFSGSFVQVWRLVVLS
jgi:hypothetical protein